MARKRRRTQQNEYDGTSKTTKYDVNNSEPQKDQPGTSETTNDGLETKPKNNKPVENDDIDENEDLEQNSERVAKRNSQQEKELTKKNDVDFFFKSMAEKVKKFPKKGISEAKEQVLKLVLKLEEQCDPDIPPTLIPYNQERPMPALTPYYNCDTARYD